MQLHWRIFAGIAAGVVGTAFWLHPPSSSQDWAAWVQAFGASLGIGIAIWVPAMQHRRELEREHLQEKAEIRHDLQSIREELSVMSEGMRYSVGNVFANPFPNGIFMLMWRPDVNAYVVYHSTSDRVGRIPCQNLRRGIIRTHARLRGLILSFGQNYELLRDMEVAEAELNANPDVSYYHNRYERCQARLRQLAVGLREAYEATFADVDGLIAELDRAIKKLG